jgi:hypothetical protein
MSLLALCPAPTLPAPAYCCSHWDHYCTVGESVEDVRNARRKGRSKSIQGCGCRYWINEPGCGNCCRRISWECSQNEVAKIMGTTRQNIQNIEMRVLLKLVKVGILRDLWAGMNDHSESGTSQSLSHLLKHNKSWHHHYKEG